VTISRIFTRDGNVFEGDFTPEQLEVIIERAGMEGYKDTAEVEPATPEETAQAKEHPEELWIEPPKPKRPEPETPKTEIIGGVNDIVDAGKNKFGFQFQMPKEEV
jgi:hypothetical protein